LKLPNLFGNTAAVRVLEVLASKPGLVWTRALLADAAGVDRRTLQRILPRLRGLDVVRFDAKFGVLAVNTDNRLTEALLAFYQALAAYQAPKRAADA